MINNKTDSLSDPKFIDYMFNTQQNGGYISNTTVVNESKKTYNKQKGGKVKISDMDFIDKIISRNKTDGFMSDNNLISEYKKYVNKF